MIFDHQVFRSIEVRIFFKQIRSSISGVPFNHRTWARIVPVFDPPVDALEESSREILFAPVPPRPVATTWRAPLPPVPTPGSWNDFRIVPRKGARPLIFRLPANAAN